MSSIAASNGAGTISDQISGPIIASIVIVVVIAIIGIAAAFAVLCGCRCCRKRKEKTSDFLDDRTSYEAWSSKASLGTYELQHPSRTVARDPNMDFVMGPGDHNYHQNRLSGWKSSLRNSTAGR